MTEKDTSSMYRADPDAVWKETVSNEIKAVLKWEEEWGYLVDSYKKCQRDSAEVDVFKEEEVTETEEKILPKYPNTTAKHIGWLSGKPECSHERFGEYSRPLRTLYKVFGWPPESCP